MKTWKCSAHVTISLSTIVEAETEAEARAIANYRALETISGNNGCAEDEYWVTSGELDGEPTEIRVEERK